MAANKRAIVVALAIASGFAAGGTRLFDGGTLVGVLLGSLIGFVARKHAKVFVEIGSIAALVLCAVAWWTDVSLARWILGVAAGNVVVASAFLPVDEENPKEGKFGWGAAIFIEGILFLISLVIFTQCVSK